MQALTIMPREANIRQRPVLLWTKRDAKMNARTLEKKKSTPNSRPRIYIKQHLLVQNDNIPSQLKHETEVIAHKLRKN